MLVLTRKIDEKISIGDNITIMVLDVLGDRVRLGIQAPISIPIWRTELLPGLRLPPTDEVQDDHMD
jgi:carbon storage regulator